MAHLPATEHALLLTCLAGLLGTTGCDADGPLPEDFEVDDSLIAEDIEDFEDFEDTDNTESPQGAADFEFADDPVASPWPLSHKGNTIASGDLDADGTHELYTAFYSPVHGAAIYRGTKTSPTHTRVYGLDSNTRVTHMAAGDVNGDGKDELYIAFEETAGGFHSSLYKMDEHGSLTTVLGSANVGITALTVGDADGTSGEELYSAYVDSYGYGSIYRSQSGSSRGSWIDGASSTTFTALSTVDFTGSGPEELCVAFQDQNETGIYRGSNQFYTSPGSYWSINAMESGDVDADGDEELYIAFHNVAGQSSIYRSDLGTGLNSLEYGPLTVWDIASILVANLDADAAEEIATSFNHVSGVASMYLSETGSLPSARIYGPSSIWEL
ncbi:MAG: FG-GAP repeat domain-containing protein [Nannocystales bacterium]